MDLADEDARVKEYGFDDEEDERILIGKRGVMNDTEDFLRTTKEAGRDGRKRTTANVERRANTRQKRTTAGLAAKENERM